MICHWNITLNFCVSFMCNCGWEFIFSNCRPFSLVMHGLPNCPQPSNVPPNTHLLIFFPTAHPIQTSSSVLRWPKHHTATTTAMDGAMATAMEGTATTRRRQWWWTAPRQQQQRWTAQRGCNGNGRHNGNAKATTAMHGTTAMAMDGSAAMQWWWRRWTAQRRWWWMARRRRDANGRRDGNAMAMTVTAMEGTTAGWRQRQQTRGFCRPRIHGRGKITTIN